MEVPLEEEELEGSLRDRRGRDLKIGEGVAPTPPPRLRLVNLPLSWTGGWGWGRAVFLLRAGGWGGGWGAVFLFRAYKHELITVPK